jgi:hypothetical protein
MARKFSSSVLICCVLTAPVVLTAQSSDQTPSPETVQAVLAAFPKDFLFDGKPPSFEDDQSSPSRACATVFRQKDDGSPDLIAAVYNGKGSEVAMLAHEQGAARIIDAVNDQQLDLGGEFCSIEIINLADPADSSSPLAKTIAASFSTNASDSEDYYFVWNGNKLVNIAALDHEPGLVAHRTKMAGSYAVDIDHSGPVQIVGSNSDSDKFPLDDGISASGTHTLFRYNGKVYAPVKTLIAIQEFEPNLPKTHDELAEYKFGAPQWVIAIGMHQTPAPRYQMKIINGDRDGSNRVSSAKVEVDGVTIVRPAEVNQGVETLTRTIHLRRKSAIKVTVDGPAKSHVNVVVE